MDKPCEFCGSKQRLIPTDYYDRPDATEPVKTPCCIAQKRNMDFKRKRYDPTDPDSPDLEDISDIDSRV